MDRWETQLRKGLVELAILAAIGRGETYGYRIVEAAPRARGTRAHGEHGLSRFDAAGSRRVSGSPHRGITQRTDATLLSIDRRGPAAPSPVGGELEDGFSISRCLD